MATNKHYMKVFLTDDDESWVVNFGGLTTEAMFGADKLASGIGYDIKGEMNKILDEDDSAIYGFRIDYTVTPIRTDPFK